MSKKSLVNMAPGLKIGHCIRYFTDVENFFKNDYLTRLKSLSGANALAYFVSRSVTKFENNDYVSSPCSFEKKASVRCCRCRHF